MVEADVGQYDSLGLRRGGCVVACSETRLQNGPLELRVAKQRQRSGGEKLELRSGYPVRVGNFYGPPHRGSEVFLRDEPPVKHDPLGVGEDVRRKVRPASAARPVQGSRERDGCRAL